MRILPLVLGLALVTACGVSKEEHQRVLDDQQRLSSANASLEAKLAQAQAELDALQGAGAQDALAQAHKKVKLLSAALRARDAQIAWDAQAVNDAERLVKAAYDDAKAAGSAHTRALSNAFDLVKKKTARAGQSLTEVADALSKEAL